MRWVGGWEAAFLTGAEPPIETLCLLPGYICFSWWFLFLLLCLMRGVCAWVYGVGMCLLC